MREQPEVAEARAAWLNQPEEKMPVDVERFDGRRVWELFVTTRSEVLGSILAALFFAGVVAWRFAPERDRLVQAGCAGVAVWAAVTVIRFRRSIGRGGGDADALARTGLEHYRAELQRRRDHLRSEWIWHGPLLLACGLAAAAVAGRAVRGRLWDALPVVVVLAVWAAMGIRRRLRQAAELQAEIDEIDCLSSVEE